MHELISIVIPVYNVEKYIDACMDSVINQTYKFIEIILVDDGSKDESGKKCDYYAGIDNRVKVIHKENGGLSDARNEGLKYISGSYVVFIDSDDVVSSQYIEYLYALLNHSNADIGICDVVHCYSKDNVTYRDESEQYIFTSESAICEMFYQKTFLVSACGKIYKKNLFDTIKFPKGMIFEDIAIMYLIFEKAQKVVYGNAKLYGYMHRGNSITTNSFSEKDLDILKICDEINRYSNDKSKKIKCAARAYCVNAYLRIYLNAEPEGKYKNEIKNCRKRIFNNWVKVFCDKHIRSKLRLALILFLFGRTIIKIIYKKVNRWS